jgi:predicted GNAT family N-acyltransferase
MPPQMIAREGRLFSAVEHNAFIDLVLAGGEVTENTLRENVPVARCLAYLRDGESLLGVAALKVPRPDYRQSIRMKSGVAIPPEIFPYELGYVFVAPEVRGNGHCGRLVEAALGRAGARGLFATARLDNAAMHATLERYGFARAGTPYPGRNEPETIQLFLLTVP